MYQDTSLERDGAPTRQEAERDAYLDGLFAREHVAAAARISDDPWSAAADRDDEVVF